MTQKVFEQVWTQLRAKKSQYREFLEQITIRNLRGISDLTIRLDFPVTVLAGPNASGKTTILFACACGYHSPGSSPRDYVPSTLFPNLKLKKDPVISDPETNTSLDFYYTHQGGRPSMKWVKGKSWSKSFMGQKGGKQPERKMYLRTLANLTSPSEVRSVLQIAQQAYTTAPVTADLLAFAQQILPISYRDVTLISKGSKDLLFASRTDGSTHYSEFHMSAGERAVLRISKDISNLRDALVLIDEIEAGLHPITQQLFMLQLQRLALRNNLQIIVTSHSPVVLDSVPIEARVFLERTDGNVIVKPAYRDIIQKAFYGQSLEKLSILCEDDMGEGFLTGVLDYLNPKIGLAHDDMVIGRDTGKDQFAMHIEAIGKFRQLEQFLFVLDGDAVNLEANLKTAASQFGASIQPLFLPGTDIPERWAWDVLRTHTAEYADLLGVAEADLRRHLSQADQLYSNATDKPTNIMKNKFFTFSQNLRREGPNLMRTLARNEAQNLRPGITPFVNELENQIRNWQSRK